MPRDTSCSAPPRTRRALSTGPPRVPLCASVEVASVLRAKAEVSRRSGGTLSLPTYKAGRGRSSTRTRRVNALLCGAPPSGSHPASQCVATPPLDHLVANHAARCSSSAGGSPEQELQRRPPPGAAVHPAGSLFSPNQAPKSSLGKSLVVSPPFHWPPAPPVRRISAGTAALHGQGPNCATLFLSREFYANQGHGCESEKLSRDPGAKPHLK
jgi:hypothetical protein